MPEYKKGYYSYDIKAYNNEKEKIAELVTNQVMQFVIPDLDLEKKFKTLNRTAEIKSKSPDGVVYVCYWKPGLGIPKKAKAYDEPDSMFLPGLNTVNVIKSGKGWCIWWNFQQLQTPKGLCWVGVREEDLSLN